MEKGDLTRNERSELVKQVKIKAIFWIPGSKYFPSTVKNQSRYPSVMMNLDLGHGTASLKVCIFEIIENFYLRKRVSHEAMDDLKMKLVSSLG